MTYSKIPTVLKSAYGTTSSFTKKEHATDKVGQSFLFKETAMAQLSNIRSSMRFM